MAVMTFAREIAKNTITTMKHFGVVVPEDEIQTTAYNLAVKFFEYDAELMHQFMDAWIRFYCEHNSK